LKPKALIKCTSNHFDPFKVFSGWSTSGKNVQEQCKWTRHSQAQDQSGFSMMKGDDIIVCFFCRCIH